MSGRVVKSNIILMFETILKGKGNGVGDCSDIGNIIITKHWLVTMMAHFCWFGRFSGDLTPSVTPNAHTWAALCITTVHIQIIFSQFALCALIEE